MYAKKPPVISHLGRSEYQPVWQSMQRFTRQRNENTRDELWITEHHPVYTQGLNGRREHLLSTADIPVIQVDRGGQVTYHGPGQLVIYFLLDLNRLGKGVRQLVTDIEQSIIDLLADYGVQSHARKEAPGVYIGQAKIAALGLRIRKGYSYHGLSLNLDMNLSPFSGINPCGFRGLQVTQLCDHVNSFETRQVTRQLCSILLTHLGYDK
jgi:lipoyl(octanoyl) transferase